MGKVKKLHFRVETMKLLHEIADCALPRTMGALKIPLNEFRVLLGQVAQRAIELDDPIMNRLMFDLTLYDVPEASSKEYGKMMKAVYKREEEFTAMNNEL